MELFDLDTINAFKETLDNAKKIAIIGHKHTDADCLGSALAISCFFEKKNIETKVIIPDELPNYLSWITGIKDVMIYDKAPWKAVNFITESDVIFMVDFSDLARIDDIADSIEVSKALKINIDHHREPKSIADFCFVDFNRSSASELVFEFLSILDKDNIDNQIAEYIYMGIVADTGSFAYDSADSKTFRVAAKLLDYDINKSKIINGLFNNHTYNRMKLLGYLLSEKMVYNKKYNFSFIYFSVEEQERFNYQPGDHENIVNMPLSISDVNFSIFLFETEDSVKVSLRSIGDIDVNKISRKYFNGGGHKNAAGGRSQKSLIDIVNLLQNNIEEIINVGRN